MVVAPLRSSSPRVSVIVWGVAKTPVVSKSIVFAPAVVFAWPIAQRSVPVLPSSSVLVTVKVASSVRSSSAVSTGLNRLRCRPQRASRRRRGHSVISHEGGSRWVFIRVPSRLSLFALTFQ